MSEVGSQLRYADHGSIVPTVKIGIHASVATLWRGTDVSGEIIVTGVSNAV